MLRGAALQEGQPAGLLQTCGQLVQEGGVAVVVNMTVDQARLPDLRRQERGGNQNCCEQL